MLYEQVNVFKLLLTVNTVETKQPSVFCFEVLFDVFCGTHAFLAVWAAVRIDATVSLHMELEATQTGKLGTTDRNGAYPDPSFVL